MRRYDEAIEVRSEAGADAGPTMFVWRCAVWKVLGVEARWKETADWWSHPSGDLLAESEVWRVVAASGRTGEPGVYELARTFAGDCWRLRAVVD